MSTNFFTPAFFAASTRWSVPCEKGKHHKLKDKKRKDPALQYQVKKRPRMRYIGLPCNY